MTESLKPLVKPLTDHYLKVPDTQSPVDTGGSVSGWSTTTQYYPQYVVSQEPYFDEKAALVLCRLVQHADTHGFVHIEEEAEPDDNSLTTHALLPDETFEELVERLYQELCVVRGRALA